MNDWKIYIFSLERLMAFISNPEFSEETCFCFSGRDIFLKKSGELLKFNDLIYFNKLDKNSDFFEEKAFGICAVSVSEGIEFSQEYVKIPMRQFFADNGEELIVKSSRSRAILNWRREMRFCPSCGKPLVESEKFSARECPVCHKIYFPRIEPCVIVLVRNGEKILLARHAQRNQDIYACIAGFIESGETAEQAVKREVKEEIGIEIQNVVYKGSQSWPFPDQLMLAFTAEYKSGDIVLQKEEISDAGWFSKEECPETPLPGSVAYRLIHDEF